MGSQEEGRSGSAELGSGASRRMASLIGAYQLSAAIGALARFGVADALTAGPASDPEAAASFEESLSRIAVARDRVVAAVLDLSGARVMVDVGGGRGSLLIALLAANTHLRGILFDLPAVVENGRVALVDADVADRCEVASGDFRDGVPPGGDVYLLSWILHDWDDASARLILANCRSVMGEGARLLIVEMIVPEPGDPAARAFERLIRQADLEMLAVVGGRERTATQFGALLAASGFTVVRIMALPGLPWSVLEASAVD
jgi:hypothetical protein